MSMIFRLALIGAFLLAADAWSAPETGPVQRDHIEVELVAETLSVQPGGEIRVGLRMRPDEGWHTYWVNPGDSGLPIRLEWTAPDGARVSAIAWPYPDALPIGHLVNYGYEGEHLLPATVVVPADLQPGSTFTLDLYADWLVCEVECIPGDADLRLELPVRDTAPATDPDHTGLFAWADSRRPQAVDWPARFSTEARQLSVSVESREALSAEGLAFFPAEENLVDHAADAFVAVDNGRVQISQRLSTYFTGAPETLSFLLVDTASGQAWSLQAEPGDLATSGDAGTLADARPNLALVLLLALAGGVLLNLMPCVFPVLSIKAMSVVGGAGQDQRAHGLAYTAGVVGSFAVLAAMLLALRAGGEALGWGFQLQSPWFVGILIYVFFAMGLALSGVFEFGSRMMGLGQHLTERAGLRGSFFTGILACVVASPCTAPFMGTALGVAVLLPWPLAMSVFLALGLGLALPMLALGFWPGLARHLPRPGPWMDTFKQAMAFPLYLAAVWLLWVLARQTDPNGLALVLTGMVALAFALWLAGKRDRNPTLAAGRHIGVALSLLFAVVALASAARFEAQAPAEGTAWWESYSPERLEQLIQDPERAVLVNMTADWCVTCLVNERAALNTEAVRRAMADNDVVYLKGDWTRRDPVITNYLARYERNGVPLYVAYPRNGDEPRVLPQILTPGLVVQALENL
ncbi:MAG: thiol:disulfide interchange protein [Wenzhouxiangella sp.]|nr:MAG: thiol:disulfide interchange protein [Wenzhouxiangella sp.]